MNLIIDGYNLLFSANWPGQSHNDLETRREELICAIVRYRSRTEIKRVILVFDGQAQMNSLENRRYCQGVEILYSNQAGGADEEILTLCHSLKQVTLVTADRKLSDRARRYQAQVVKPDQFVSTMLKSSQPSTHQLLDTAWKEAPPSSEEVENWLRIFSLGEAIEIPPTPKRPTSAKQAPKPRSE